MQISYWRVINICV